MFRYQPTHIFWSDGGPLDSQLSSTTILSILKYVSPFYEWAIAWITTHGAAIILSEFLFISNTYAIKLSRNPLHLPLSSTGKLAHNFLNFVKGMPRFKVSHTGMLLTKSNLSRLSSYHCYPEDINIVWHN